MTLPLKGRRSIDVDGVRYHWLVRNLGIKPVGERPEGFLSLTVERREQPSSTLRALFKAHYVNWLRFDDKLTVSVTPDVVRRVIQYGLANGWKPATPDADVTIQNAETLFAKAEAV